MHQQRGQTRPKERKKKLEIKGTDERMRMTRRGKRKKYGRSNQRGGKKGIKRGT